MNESLIRLERKGWLGFAVTAASLALLLPVVVWEDRRADRALGFLTPVMDWVLWLGRGLSVVLQERAVISGTAALLLSLVVAWVVRRAGCLGAAWFTVAIGLSLFAEGFVVAGRFEFGVAMFAAAAVVAAVGGLRIKTLSQESEFPEALEPRLEAAVIAFLSLIGCVLTLYALNEHPEYFFNEKISTFLQASSLAGLRVFMASGWFVGNSVGAVELPILWLLTKILGCSVLAVRLTPALAAAATIPVFYGFVRRIGGPVAAAIASVLLLAQPTHLWFARTDYTHFVYVALYVVIMAWIALSALEKGGWWWLAVSAAMAGSRFVYASGQVAWLIPVGLMLHATFIDRKASKPLRVGWVAVGAGALLWAVGASVAVGLARAEFRWVPAVGTYGAASWQQIAADAALSERLAAALWGAAANIKDLLSGLFSNIRFGELFWYRWSNRPEEGVWAVSAAAALIVPALGWLATRWRRREAALLLGWIAVAVVPGCLSEGMGVRRVLMLFPAVYAATGLFLAALAGSIIKQPRPAARRLVSASLVALLLGILVVGVNASLRAGTRRPFLNRQADFVGSLLGRNDLVVHDFNPRHEATLAYLNLPALIDEQNPRGLQFASRERWPGIAFRPRFDGDAEFYQFTGLEQVAAESARSIDPSSVAFVLRDSEANQSVFSLLDQLYPGAATSTCCNEVPGGGLRAFEVPRESMSAAARPELRWRDEEQATGLARRLMPAVELAAVVDSTRPQPSVRAGLIVAEPGWYELAWAPGCDAAVWIDDSPAERRRWRALAPGVHALSVALADVDSCESGLDLMWRRFPEWEGRSIDGDSLTAPWVARIDSAMPEPVVEFGGYESHQAIARELPGLWDLDGDAAAGVAALCHRDGVWSVQLFDADGGGSGSWRLPGGPRPHGARIAIAPAGELVVLSAPRVEWYDREGGFIRSWTSEESSLLTDIAFDGDGRLWLSQFDSRRILVLGDDGIEATFELAGIAENRDSRPVGLAAGPSGRLFVMFEQGLVQVLRPGWKDRSLSVEWSIRIPLPAPLDFVRHEVSELGWFHATTRPPSGWRSYDSDGTRRLAASPDQSLFGSEISGGSVVSTVGDAVLVYDDDTATLWKMQANAEP